MSDDTLFPSLVEDLKAMEGGPVLEARRITPAEFRTGISDRAAAAFADLAELRRRFCEYDGVDAMLDRIAAALRERR